MMKTIYKTFLLGVLYFLRGVMKVVDFIIPTVGKNELADFGIEEAKYMERDGMFANAEIKERLETLMRDTKVDMKHHINNNLGVGIFLVLSFVGIFLDLFLLQFLALLLALRYMLTASSYDRRLQREFGFIDGIMFVCSQVSKDIHEAVKDPEVLKDLKQQVEKDLAEVESK